MISGPLFNRKKLYKSKFYLLLVVCYLLFITIWPLAFISIYSRPHSRIAASRWIYENIPAGSTLTCEHWDDCLPLPFTASNPSDYNILQLPLYDPDTTQKWQDINKRLKKADYLILSSNRLYGSIPTVPDRYPITANFYQQLFNGAAGFTPVAVFTSRPYLPLPFLRLCITPPFEWYGKIAAKLQPCNQPGLTIIDDYADESFTVYDHPKVIIFKKL